MQARGLALITALILGMALSGCAGALHSAGGPAAGANNTAAAAAAPAADNVPSAAAGPQRDLTPAEKKIIVEAVAPSLRDAAAAKYHWVKFPVMPSEAAPSYCAMVDAKSPYAAYNGRQAYIVEIQLTGGYVTAATLGLIAGGKDTVLVRNMCEKYGLDPNKAT